MGNGVRIFVVAEDDAAQHQFRPRAAPASRARSVPQVPSGVLLGQGPFGQWRSATDGRTRTTQKVLPRPTVASTTGDEHATQRRLAKRPPLFTLGQVLNELTQCIQCA